MLKTYYHSPHFYHSHWVSRHRSRWSKISTLELAGNRRCDHRREPTGERRNRASTNRNESRFREYWVYVADPILTMYLGHRGGGNRVSCCEINGTRRNRGWPTQLSIYFFPFFYSFYIFRCFFFFFFIGYPFYYSRPASKSDVVPGN